MSKEQFQLSRYKSIEEQEKMAVISDNEKPVLKFAEPLTFEIPEPEMLSEISRCHETYLKSKADLDLFALAFRDFGKGRIKKCGVSPDAFIQMAIQLANYRDQGKFVLTYEPASARFFANSRTETLRTVNDDSCAFVYAMLNENESKEAKIKLLKKACETHVNRNKKCMVGQGVDRHLFVLYVLSQGFGVQSPFLDNYVGQKWKLSTSHVSFGFRSTSSETSNCRFPTSPINATRTLTQMTRGLEPASVPSPPTDTVSYHCDSHFCDHDMCRKSQSMSHDIPENQTIE